MSSERDNKGDGGVIDVEDYGAELTATLVRHGLGPENVMVVEDVADPKNPFRVAMTSKIEKIIFIQREITREEHVGVISALKGFDARVELLSDDLTFLKHTLLHEICHILWKYKNCDECDAWAFYEMKF